MNIVLGPHHARLAKLFRDKTPPPKVFQTFLSSLAPPEAHKQATMFVPVHFSMCHVPLLHKDLRVLVALADCVHEDIFSEPGCRAIIELAWGQERFRARCLMIMALVEIGNLLQICFIQRWSALANEKQLTISIALAYMVCAVGVILDISQTLGYLRSGLIDRFLASSVDWFNRCILLLNIAIILATHRMGVEAGQQFLYCTALGCVLFLKWIRLLVALRQVKAVGLRILPIMDTMLDVGPFSIVLAVYMLAATSAYYALGRYDFLSCFIILYKMAVMSEVDLYEFEGVYNPSMRVVNSTGVIEQVMPSRTEYWLVTRLIMLIISFVVGISMMNLFVAVLCISYAKAHEKAEQAFTRSRACIVLDLHSIRVGFQSLQAAFCIRRSRVLTQRVSVRGRSEARAKPFRGRSKEVDTGPCVSSATMLEMSTMDAEAPPMDYVWLCYERSKDRGHGDNV
jgi:hypothetical protein